MAQFPRIREYRHYRVHYLGAILPILSVLGYNASILVILDVQASCIVLANYSTTGTKDARMRAQCCVIGCMVIPLRPCF